MHLETYEVKYADIITGIKPWTSPDGQTSPNRQAILKNDMGRLIKATDKMCETILGKDGRSRLDPQFTMEDRLMNGGIPLQPQQYKKKSQDVYPVHDIPVDSIIESDFFQMRADGVKCNAVTQYAGIMKDNDPDGWMMFPEILLMRDIGDLKHYLIGGFHRLAAIKENGYDTINALCFDGDRRAGLIKAANENSDRSQRRTHEDIKHVCRTLITSFPDWGFGQLAKWGGVDRNTMERHYKEMQDEGVAPDRPDALRYITRHGTEATRKATRTSQTFDDEYPNLPTEALMEKWHTSYNKVNKLVMKDNNVSINYPLIPWELFLDYAKKNHQGLLDNQHDFSDDRKAVINQVKIWAHLTYQAQVASDIFRAMLAIFDYELDARDGKRFPEHEECNWIVTLGLPAIAERIFENTQNRWNNNRNSIGLESVPFYSNDAKEVSLLKSAPLPRFPHLIAPVPERLSVNWIKHLNIAKDYHALGQDISNRADWIERIKGEADEVQVPEESEPSPVKEEGFDSQGLEVLTGQDRIKPTGLRSVLEGFHRGESVLVDQAGDGTRLAALYNTTPEKVLALRDEILAESPPKQEYPTPLQIEPLGESNDDMTLPEPAEASNEPIYITGEPDSTQDKTDRTFDQLTLNEQLSVRYALNYSYRLCEIEAIPAEIRALAAQLHEALDVYTPEPEEAE